MQYFYTTEPLMYVFGPGEFRFSSFGMEDRQVALAVQDGFQQPGEDGKGVVSILPISDEKLFGSKLGHLLEQANDTYKVLSEAEAIAERDRLKQLAQAREEVEKNIPTEEDIYKAQQLLVLSEINNKLGGLAHV